VRRSATGHRVPLGYGSIFAAITLGPTRVTSLILASTTSAIVLPTAAFRACCAYRHAPRPKVPIDPDDPAVILMSGGTTGTPKGAVGLHAGLVAAGLQSHAWLRPVWEDWRDIILLPLPLFHAYGHKVPAVVVLRRALPKTLLGSKVLGRILGGTPAGQHAVESEDAREIT